MFARPHPLWGEAVTAHVVARAGPRLDRRRCARTAWSGSAAFKVPKAFELVDALPRTESGKVRRADLRLAPRRLRAARGSSGGCSAPPTVQARAGERDRRPGAGGRHVEGARRLDELAQRRAGPIGAAARAEAAAEAPAT